MAAKREGRSYPVEVKAAALALLESGDTGPQVADAMGVSTRTLDNWKAGQHLAGVTETTLRASKKSLLAQLHRIAARLASTLEQEDDASLRKISIVQRTTALGILSDKIEKLSLDESPDRSKAQNVYIQINNSISGSTSTS